jgi:hypothetical protein
VGLAQAQVPTIITSSVISLLVGGAIGASVMMYLGYDPLHKPLTGGQETAEGDAQAKGGGMMGGGMRGGGPPGGMMGGGPPGGMMGKGGPPGGMRGGGPPGMAPGGAMLSGMGTPSPKAQLALLVAKINQLTNKPLQLTLDEEQRAKLSEQLKGLSDEDELSEDDAKKRLEGILDILKGQKEMLEAAGFRWPGSGPSAQRPANSPNPFAEGDGQEHLKQLEKRLEKRKSKE